MSVSYVQVENENVRPSFPVCGQHGTSPIDMIHVSAPFIDAPDVVAVRDNLQTVFKASEAVGYLIAGPEEFTAFFVSPTIICTLRNLLFSYHNKYKKTPLPYSLTTQYDPLIGKVSIVDVEDNEDLDSKWKNALGIERDPMSGDFLPDRRDYYFLKLAPGVPPSEHFLIPTSKTTDNVVAIGYPSVDAILGQGSTIIKAYHGIFEHKHAAPGRIIDGSIPCPEVFAHSASQGPGCAGAPVIDPVSGRLVGISTKTPALRPGGYNIALSVNQPEFKYLYEKYVIPTLPEDAKAIAKEYLIAS